MRRRAFLFGLISMLFCTTTVFGFTWEQDSLVVRLLLNENGFFDTPVSQVATRVNDRVHGLKLDSLPMSTLPIEIFTLDSLQSLSMVHCGVKSLPPNISQWTQLTSLNLSENILSTLPVEIGGFVHLTQLNIRSNSISYLPDTLVRLRKLFYLDIGNNLITALPNGIEALQNLTYLFADQDSLGGIPESIALLPFLKELNLSGNQISNVPVSIAAMTSLETLDISINQLTTLPDEWVLLDHLNSLDLSSNQLCGLSSPLSQWADQKQPGWQESQLCISIDPGNSIHQILEAMHFTHSFPDGFWMSAKWALNPKAMFLINTQGQSLGQTSFSARKWNGMNGWLIEWPKSNHSPIYLRVLTPLGERILPLAQRRKAFEG